MINFTYRIFGLIIHSELEIPGLIPLQAEIADVSILIGATPNQLNNVISSGVLFESAKEEFLLKIPQIANFLVQHGNQITIDPILEATSDEIRLFLMGSVFGALLFQRGFTPLHGSSVDVNGKALIILGNSAAGKSTLAASLAQSGFPFLSDDLSAISKVSGKCIILPGVPFVKLWGDTKGLLYPDNSFSRVRPQINKFIIPAITHHDSSKGLKIQTIIILKPRNVTRYHVEQIHGASKLIILREQVFRGQIIEGMGNMDHHFEMLSTLANQVRLFQLERPISPLEVEVLKNIVIKEVL